jgi:uncharacterized membrane protein YidH (DUF202 family)
MVDNVTELAIMRTRLAADRTLMAWIRTSFAMITFGFGVGIFGVLALAGIVFRIGPLETSG